MNKEFPVNFNLNYECITSAGNKRLSNSLTLSLYSGYEKQDSNMCEFI